MIRNWRFPSKNLNLKISQFQPFVLASFLEMVALWTYKLTEKYVGLKSIYKLQP